jgi:hypothetical protein
MNFSRALRGVAAASLLTGSMAVGAQVWKCEVNGAVTYSDKPCTTADNGSRERVGIQEANRVERFSQVKRCESSGAAVYTNQGCEAGVPLALNGGGTGAPSRAVDEILQRRYGQDQNVDVPDLTYPSAPIGRNSGPIIIGSSGGGGAAVMPYTQRNGDRSSRAISDFRRSNPCPGTGSTKGACYGYEIDHRIPLAAGGRDNPSNMQWLTNQQHRDKTVYERRTCAYGCGKRK